MKVGLEVLTAGKSEGKVIPITLSQFVIGRDPQCHLRPASALISKRHCALLLKNSRVFVRDFDSTNGTFINDEPLKGERELHHEDRLKVGPLLFGVRIETTAVNKPTPPPPSKSSSSGDDESIAAMLLSLQDDGPGGTGSVTVPEGSTVMEILTPPPGVDPNDPAAAAKGPPPKPKIENTSAAAKMILEKYMKRPRT